MIVADALHFVLRGFHVHVGDDDDMGLGTPLDVRHLGALLIEQEGRDVQRHQRPDLGAALLQGLLLDDAQDGEGQRFDVLYAALAAAPRTDFSGQLLQGGAQPLARHLHEAELGDAADLHPGAVRLQSLAHGVLHRLLVFGARHVDEVDDDQAADVAQAQLPGHFLGGL